jgi:SAM-dependent methyltransferase
MLKPRDQDLAVAFPLGFTQVAEALGRYEGTEENARQLCRLIELPAGARVLDVACGGGRYAVAFHRLGYRVTAFDLSPEQIEHASQHNPGPTYRVADMRDPPGDDYDLVLVPYSGFGLLDSAEEDRQALKVWRSKLKPGGWLVMEASDLDRAEYRYGRGEEPVTFDEGGRHEVYLMNWQTRMLTVTHGVEGIGSFTCRRRVYKKEELVTLVEQAGLENVQLFGSYGGAPKRPQDRAVVIARAPLAEPANR